MKFFEDKEISQGTISKIERGDPTVSTHKRFYYLEKLGYSTDKLPRLLEQENNSSQLEHLQLKSLETIIDLVGAKAGLKQLRESGLQEKLHVKPMVNFLKGKIYYQKKSYDKAKTVLLEAVKLIDRNLGVWESTNLKSSCFGELARIFFQEKKYDETIAYNQKGIDSFVEQGSRKYTKAILLSNHSLYLLKLDLLEESLEMVKSCKHNLGSQETGLSFIYPYNVEVNALIENKCYTQAIQSAELGIEIARISQSYDRSFQLWSSLGDIYFEQEEFSVALICYQTALRLKPRVSYENWFTYIRLQLGLIYIQKRDFPQAEAQLLDAVKTSDGSRMDHIYEVYNALGDLYLQLENTEKAVSSLQKALHIAQDHKLYKQEREALTKLCQCQNYLDIDQYQNYVNNLVSVSIQLQRGGDE
ncbi:tetratricopeptide repeat protein [Shimazuella alba]|uniref:Tetratricopeptide repeat protein n=1 Tax=Shimazuella alba TaxID=2690964 RepID=A0A6I4VRI0_9BACL|nr:tetratricopeptide repeat protein [Shimazuella alba]MXQ53663.1 tetratricopeptide repeat protein [Shimazuella alba]